MIALPYLSLMADPLEGPLSLGHPPDTNSRPSVVWRVSSSETVVSAGTAAVWEIRPYTLSGSRRSWTVVAEALGVATDSAWTDHAAILSVFSNHRPMAMVVELEYIGPADTAQGTVFCLETDATPAAANTLASFTDEKHYSEGSITNGSSVAVISRMHVSTWNRTSAAMAATDFPTVVVGVTGVLAGSSYRLRTTLVSEYLCNISSIMAQQAQSSPNLPALLGAGQSITGEAVTVNAGPNALEKVMAASAKLANQAAKAAGVDTVDGAIRALYSLYRVNAAAQGMRENQLLLM